MKPKPILNRLISKLINGPSRALALSAKTKIDSVVQKARYRRKFTHFLAIPMNDKAIAENFDKFKTDLLKDTGKIPKGVRKEVFQKPEKMHLTLGMLALHEDKDVKEAIATLEECKEKIIMPIVEKHGPIKIKAQGLEYFGKDPEKARVIYGSVSTENNVLQDLADKTGDFFVQKGLMKKDNEQIKLHLTLMNTSYAVDKRIIGWRPFETMDASNLMKVHKDYAFGESVIRTVQICKLGPMAENGYYDITSKIDLSD